MTGIRFAADLGGAPPPGRPGTVGAAGRLSDGPELEAGIAGVRERPADVAPVHAPPARARAGDAPALPVLHPADRAGAGVVGHWGRNQRSVLPSHPLAGRHG